MKICTRCKIQKEFTDFSRDKHCKDGLTTQCRLCRRAKTESWRKTNPDKVTVYKQLPESKERARKATAKYRSKYPEKIKSYQDLPSTKENSRKRTYKYYLKNKEQQHLKFKEWYYNNRDKERARRLNYNRKNNGLVNAYNNYKRAKKLQATPKWVNLEELKQIYINCPDGYHVDHIIPLNNKIVSGLHVPWNLQYLPARENIRKSNKLLPNWSGGYPVLNFPVLLSLGEF